MRSGNQKSSRGQGYNIDFWRRCLIFREIDILTLSVARFLIVGQQWKALEKIFLMRSNNLKSSNGQDPDIDFCVSNFFLKKSTPWPCLWLDFWLWNLIGRSLQELSNEVWQLTIEPRTRSGHQFPTSTFDLRGNWKPDLSDLVCDWI